MLVSDLFRECVRAQMSGIPFRYASGRGASIRHIPKMTCLPDYLIKHSHILGDGIQHVRLPEILGQTIDAFILPDLPWANSGAPVTVPVTRILNLNPVPFLIAEAMMSNIGGAATLVGALMDNISFTVAMIPNVAALEQQGVNVTPLWWALGVELGGNGTHICATANVIRIAEAERARTPLRWLKVGRSAA